MKAWWQSKTVIVNLIALLVLVLQSTELAALVPQDAWQYVVAVQSVLNVVLRFVTTTGISVGVAK